MSTIEEFENAPVGATATAPNGNIALKTVRRGFEWSMFDSRGDHCDVLSSGKMVGFTLNPATPTSAREALDLAWELAHPVKEGQHIPEGTRLLDRSCRNDLSAYETQANITINARESLSIRTLDPLPDPEPDWLDAPAVIATCGCHDGAYFVWEPADDGIWVCSRGENAHWGWLRDVTPLYPKEDQ